MAGLLRTVAELENHAAKHLSANAYSYFANGTGNGVTLKENTDAFKRF